MEKDNEPGKSNPLMAVSLLYNIALLIFFTILMLIVQEWYMLIMLIFLDKNCFSKRNKNIENSGD